MFLRSRFGRAQLSLLIVACLALTAPLLGGSTECISSVGLPLRSGGTNGVESIFAVDLDGDNDTDILSASFGDDRISWFENEGGTPPSFVERTIDRTADSALAVYADDIDGDGDIDVVSASSNDGTVAWYANTGGSPIQFVPRTVVTDAQGANSVFAFDLDADGDLDLLSASAGDDTIAWYENDGTSSPSFTARVISSDADNAASVHAADIDGDGDADVVSASRFDNKIAWYSSDALDCDAVAGEAPPTFTEQIISTNAAGANSVFAADIDGDGDVDVLAASPADDSIRWFDNDGACPPVFTKRVIADDAMGVRRARAFDVDEDGDVDIVAASAFDDTVAWYSNDGASPPTFTRRILAADVESADDALAADIDMDGDVDVVSAASIPGLPARKDRIDWYDNDGATPPNFTSRVVSRGAIAAEAIEQADFDGDLDFDLVVASLENDTVAWFENLSTDPPSFVERVLASDIAGASALHVTDLDGDLDTDIVVTALNGNTLTWFDNDGTASPVFTRRDIPTNAEGPSGVFSADLNADGDRDLIVASRNDDTVAWLESDGGTPPTFTETVISSDAAGARSVFAVDIEDDGDVDVFAALADDNRLTWYESDGADPPTFTERIVSFIEAGARWVWADDLNLDGKIDLISAAANIDTVAWFEQSEDEETSDVLFTRREISVSANFVTRVRTDDFNADGRPDILVVSSADNTVSWFENVDPGGGAGPTFTERPVSTTLEQARDAVAIDLDGGPLDIVAAFQFEVTAHLGGAVETCGGFDADLDGRIGGVELVWLALGFAQSCADPAMPEAEWWAPVDYTGDCLLDGEDLSILTSSGVWGRTPDECSFICPAP